MMDDKSKDFDPVERVDVINETINKMKSDIRKLEKEARLLRIQAMGKYISKYNKELK